ncbi:putative ribonuclease H-like domain-containing protein [Tanacetum coccineum]
MLLMVIPNEHQLTFNQYKDAKTLFAAIQIRFDGNDVTKKTQKTLLKRMYKNFNAPSIESLDCIFNRLQKIRNKPDLDSISFDDLYNNFKIVEKEVKRTVTSISNSGSQNMAFVSTPSSTNEVNTVNVQVSTTNTTVSTNSTLDSTANLSDATIYDFLANQPNGSQLVHEHLKQIYKDDFEEMDLKWQLALLSMRARRYYPRTGKRITINGSDTIGYDKSKVECFNCHKMGHFARECRNPRNQENMPRNQDSSRRTVNVEDTSSKAMVAIDGAGFDWNFEALKTQLDNLRVEFNKSEFNLATYKRDASFKDSEINTLNIQIEKLKKEKESNQIKINNFENASKSLDKLIGSQISDNNRKGVGYNVVPPPPTGLFAPPTIDLSNSGLKEFQQPEFEGNGFKTNKADESEGIVLKYDNVQHKPKQANQPKKAVLTKSSIVPVNAARPINTVAPKSFMNVAKTRPNAFQKSHSLSRRPFYQQTALKNRNLNDKVNTAKVNSVNTAKVNFVNTAKGNKVTSVVREQGINVVKSLACWVWRPKIKVDSSLELKVLVVHHTTNGHQFTMSNRQERIDSSKANSNCTHISILLITYIHMANMDFCGKHNMVAFLQKPTGSEEFHQIVDFLASSHIRHLQLSDADGISSFPNTEIFDQLTLIGYVSTDDKLTFQKGVHIPLFDIMLIHDQPSQGEGPTITVESQHTPIASLPTSQPTTSQLISSQEQPSQVPITEPITDSFTMSYPTQKPSPMPHDSPFSGGHTLESYEGSKKLNELTELCTKLSDKVTNLEDDLKQTRKIYGKALTKLVKKVKHLEAKLKSTTERRKARMVISDDEEDLVSEDTSKQGRMTETEYEGFTLYAAKILADASREKVKTYTRRRSTDSLRDSIAGGLFSTTEEVQGKEQISTDEKVAQKLNDKEMARAAASEEQEMIDFEKALELQKQLDEREETDNIDWNTIAEQV